MLSLGEKVSVLSVIFLSVPMCLPTSTSATATATGVATAPPEDVVSVFTASFFLHAATVASAPKAATVQTSRVLAKMLIRLSSGSWRKREHLSRMDQIGVLDLVAVRGIDRVPFVGVAQLAFGDLGQAVTGLNGDRARLLRGSRRRRG